MKKLTYLGPHKAATVEGFGTVERGESYEVDDEVAAMLLATPKSWKQVLSTSVGRTTRTDDTAKEE